MNAVAGKKIKISSKATKFYNNTKLLKATESMTIDEILTHGKEL